MRPRNRRLALATATVGVGMAMIAGTAVGTPGSGVTASILGTGTSEQKVKTQGNQPYDVVMQSITIAPGGHTGWHTHPGSAVALVTSGQLTIYDGNDESCSPRTFEAGKVYVDPGYGHVHLGRNEGDVPTEILVTYLDMPVGGGVRIDAEDPGNCSF
jgi:quercetin dioxygenase-like cupin family protein